MSVFSKLKQFNDLKSRAKQMQDALAKESAEGTAGWGKVKITMDGNQKVISVVIDPSALSDGVKLAEMVRDAINDAVSKIQRVMATKLKDIGGLDLASEFGDAMK